jgi:twitching motility protein PilT
MRRPDPHPQLLALLRDAVRSGASDLHLTPGEPPALRIDGRLAPLAGHGPVPAESIAVWLTSLLVPAQVEALERERCVDLSLSLPEGQRFRLNAFSARGQPALAIRRLEPRIRSLEELRLPAALEQLTALQDGLVLVTGATGSGKSTTLATLLDLINARRPCHILTLEDPVEYLHSSRQALVRQRELHTDFPAFAGALRATLREDPDVILVGELRDAETMRTALMAAETGHLVFSTLHAGSAIAAAERLIGAFAGEEQDSIRHQLSLVLRAVATQRLLPGRAGGRVPVIELLLVSPAVANLLRQGKASQIQSAMEAGASAGMRTLEQELAEVVARGWVEEEVARQAARDPTVFAERLRQARAGAGRPAPAPARALAPRGAPWP